MCASLEVVPALCLVASRDGAGLASCCDTQEAELAESMTYIAMREGGCLAFTMYTEAILNTLCTIAIYIYM